MIKINETIGFDYNMNPKDVEKIKRMLNKLGYYQSPDYGITPYSDVKMFDAIESFQKAEKLKVDGIIKPDGKTIAALNKNLPSDKPGVKGPYICPSCGGRHGGVYGDLCQWCTFK